jgi:putative transposase
VTDLTYVPTRTGMAYVCVITDAFSRMIVGWRVASHMRIDMVLDALEMAGRQPSAGCLVGLVTHSDAGSQYTSVRFTKRVDEIGARPSIGSVADSFDNAPMESFWGSMQIELLDRQRWRTILELAIADYIEHFYNPARRHSSLGYLTPDEFETLRSPDNPARTLTTVGQ